MPKLQVLLEPDVAAKAEYAGPLAVPGTRWSKLLSPADYRLWLAVSELEDGAELRWTDDHPDEGVCVFDGGLQVGDRTAQAGGALIVESGVAATARAQGTTRIAHFGAHEPGASQRGKWVHVFGPKGQFQVAAPTAGVSSDYFADSTCETCSMMLFRVNRAGGEQPRPPHSHSQDEIIYVVSGSVLLGKHEFEAGSSLCIPADVRYMQIAGERGCSFLNFRTGSSSVTRYPKGKLAQTVLEGALANGGWISGEMENVAA